MTSLNQATIVHKNPKHVAPEDYIKLVLRERPTAFGFMGRENGKLITECSPKAPLASEIMELQESFKNDHLFMYFMNASGADLPDDVQPFTITDAKEDDPTIFLAYMFEGDYNKYGGQNGKHTGEYVVDDTEVYPKLAQLFVDCEKDHGKFVEALRAPSFQQTLCNYFGNRGVYSILPPVGDPISFGKNEVGGQYDWGNVSNTHGYTVKTESSGLPGLAFLRGKSKGSAAAPAPAPTVTPDVKPPSEGKPVTQPVIAPQPSAEPEVKEENGVKLHKVHLPPKLRGNKKATNHWLRIFNNNKLDDAIQRAAVGWVDDELLPLAQRTVGSKEEVEKLATEIHNLRKARATAVAEQGREILTGKSDKPITNGKSTVREPVAEAVANNKAAADKVSDHFPVMTDKDKEKALEIIANFKSSKTGLDVQRDEAKWPTFTQELGLASIEEWALRPTEELNKLFDGNKIATCAVVEMRKKIMELGGFTMDVSKYATKGEEKPADNKTAAPQSTLGFIRGKKSA